MEIIKVRTDPNINKTNHLNIILRCPQKNINIKRKKRSRDSYELPDFKKLKISDDYEIVMNDPIVDNQNINNEAIECLQINRNNENKIINKIYQIEKKLTLFKVCVNKYIDHLQDEMNNLKQLID